MPKLPPWIRHWFNALKVALHKRCKAFIRIKNKKLVSSIRSFLLYNSVGGKSKNNSHVRPSFLIILFPVRYCKNQLERFSTSFFRLSTLVSLFLFAQCLVCYLVEVRRHSQHTVYSMTKKSSASFSFISLSALFLSLASTVYSSFVILPVVGGDE